MKVTIASKVACFLLLAGLVPLSVVGYLNYSSAVQMMTTQIEGNLDAFVETKASHINSYFEEKLKNVASLSRSPDIIDATSKLIDAYNKNGLKKDNETLLDDSLWSFLVHYVERHEYYDLFIISPTGDVVFSVAKEEDLGTNLRTGPYSATPLAESFTTATTILDATISDFKYYAPSNLPGAFITTPIYRQGILSGVLAVQMTPESIYRMVEGYSGLGRTGEIVIASRVGMDAVFLNPLRHDPDAAFKRKVTIGSNEGRPIQEAVQGKKGHGVFSDYQGKEVLASWQYLPHLRVGMVVKQATSEAYQQVASLRNRSLTVGIFSLMSLLVATPLLARTISVPITQLTKAAKRMVDGDLTVQTNIQTRDEIETLGNNFNEMVATLRNNKEEDILEDWYKSGLTGLSDQLRGEHGITPLTRTTISYLTKYLNAQMGVFYVLLEDQRLKITGSYAFTARKNLSNTCDIGEGVIGQAALEKEPILLTDVPEDYVAVRSGLGNAPPRNVLIWPVVRNDEVKGVIELGAFDSFDDRAFELLRQASENIAIAIDATLSREQTQQLLEKSQVQSEELQAQTEALRVREEELQASNQNLAEKSAKLQASEETLQQQSNELQAANETLLEKTRSLQKQNELTEQAKQDLERKASELAQASKYKSEFLANMSHELRTPLNSLLILTQILAENDEGNLTDSQVEMADIIHAGGHELLTLINDILDLAKVESGNMVADIEPTSLQHLIDRLHQQFKPVAEKKGLVLKTQLSKSVPESINSDAQKVEQILRNLLSNAMKFTETGSVTLEIVRVDEDDRLAGCKLDSKRTIGCLVVDTGIGIAEEKQQAIFESFQQADGSTSRQYGGTGLGLTISREFSKLLNGEMIVHSQSGKGSCFALCLPFDFDSDGETDSPTESITVTDKPSSPASGSRLDPDKSVTIDQTMKSNDTDVDLSENVESNCFSAEKSVETVATSEFLDDQDDLADGGKSILVVEDDKHFASILMALCRDRQFKCLVANKGKEAIQLARKYKPTGILLDLGLPDMDGLEVLEQLKSEASTQPIPIHIVSGSNIGPTAISKGAIGFLQKPVCTEDITQALSTVEKLRDLEFDSILVVGKASSMGHLLEETFQSKDVKVIEVHDDDKAYEMLIDQVFACLILDIGSKTCNGLELLNRLSKESITIPPVIIYSDEEIRLEERDALEAFGCSILIKGDFTPERISEKVKLFLHGVEHSVVQDQSVSFSSDVDTRGNLEGSTILLVDDEVRNTFALSKVLKKLGVNVLIAENGRQAIETVQREDEIDLVLMDIMMPVVDGYEAIRRIRQEGSFQSLPIIACTANAMPQDRAKCIEAGADDYITKPVVVDRLITLIKVWLSNRSVASP